MNGASLAWGLAVSFLMRKGKKKEREREIREKEEKEEGKRKAKAKKKTVVLSAGELSQSPDCSQDSAPSPLYHELCLNKSCWRSVSPIQTVYATARASAGTFP